jgi:hypothetical protein
MEIVMPQCAMAMHKNNPHLRPLKGGKEKKNRLTLPMARCSVNKIS